MDCACVYVDHDGGAEFHRDEVITARKQHVCGECNRTIEKGERYEKATGMWDGDFNTFKTCTDCLSARDSFFCGSWIYECIWEDLWNHIEALDGKISSKCIAPLTSRAREKVCEMIERAWGDEC